MHFFSPVREDNKSSSDAHNKQTKINKIEDFVDSSQGYSVRMSDVYIASKDLHI